MDTPEAAFNPKTPDFKPTLDPDLHPQVQRTAATIAPFENHAVDIAESQLKAAVDAAHTPETRSPEKSPFDKPFYLFRRKVFKIFGNKFDIYDNQHHPIMYAEQKPLKLREDFRIYTDKTKKEELLHMSTPHIIDSWATYAITDSRENNKIGSVQRKWLKSHFIDEWKFLSPEGEQIGKITESSKRRALFSRLLGGLVPQHYRILDNDNAEVARVNQHFNPFVLKYSMQIGPKPTIDTRLLTGMGILLAGIEGRQASASLSFNGNANAPAASHAG